MKTITELQTEIDELELELSERKRKEKRLSDPCPFTKSGHHIMKIAFDFSYENADTDSEGHMYPRQTKGCKACGLVM